MGRLQLVLNIVSEMQTIKDLNFHLVGFMLFTLALRKEIRLFEKGNLIIKLVFKRGKLFQI